MASKFFSRSRPDRKTAWPETPPMGGFIAIDTEWPDTAAAPGLGLHLGHPVGQVGDSYNQNYNAHFRKSASPANRPKHLDLSLSLSTSPHNAYTASALHHVALHSSNLLAVVNGMLKSPLLAAHHKPLPPRPRSISAPPTPELPELPGSILLSNRGFPKQPQSASATDDERRRLRLAYQPGFSTAHTAPPTSAPMDSFFPPMPEARKSRLNTPRLSAIDTAMDSRLTLCSQPTNPTSSFESAAGNASESASGLRPSPLNFDKNGNAQSGNTLRPAVLGNRSRSYGGPSHAMRSSLSSIHSDGQQIEQLKLTLDAQNQTISTLTDQFASLKGSHEAHVSSLIESHAKEVDSLKTYVEGLEQRQSTAKTLHHDPPQDDQGLSVSKEIQAGSPQPTTPAVPPKAPGRSTKEEDRVRREYSKLKKKIETANSQTIAIMTQLENARKQESAFRNEVQALEVRLEEANTEKVDALEAAFTYEGEITKLQRRQKSLIKENEVLRVEALHAQTDDLAGKLDDARSEISKLTAELKTANERRPEEDAISAFVRQIEDLQSKLRESDTDGRRLKKENEHFRIELDDAEERLKQVMKVNEKLVRGDGAPQGGDYGRIRRENLDLKAKCSKQEEAMTKIQSNADEYYRLLKAEIKRKACKRQQCLEDGHLDPSLYPLANTDLSPRDKERFLSKEMRETKSKAARILGLSEDSKDHASQIRILEKENDYHVRDIVAYRVAVRDYERDTRKLAQRIQRRDDMLLQLQQQKAHPSPTRDTPQSSVSSASTGPGYSPRTPQFPAGTPSTVVTTPLSTHRIDRAASAPTNKLGPRSSFSIYKRLPKPPPSGSPSSETPPESQQNNRNPRGLGITSQPYSGTAPQASPSPRSVPRIGASPMQSLTPIREVSQKTRKNRRSMSESVIAELPTSDPDSRAEAGAGRESDASPETTSRSSSNDSARRPSLPELESTPPRPAQENAKEAEMWRTRKAAVRANVLARAESRADGRPESRQEQVRNEGSERGEGSPMGRVLRLKRSKQSLAGGSVDEGKRSPGLWREGMRAHGRARSEV